MTDLEIMDIVQSIGAIFVPVFAVWYKIDSDKKKAETQALIERSQRDIMNAIHDTKDQLSESLFGLANKIVSETEINKRQDTQIGRNIQDLEILRKKLFNGGK